LKGCPKIDLSLGVLQQHPKIQNPHTPGMESTKPTIWIEPSLAYCHSLNTTSNQVGSDKVIWIEPSLAYCHSLNTTSNQVGSDKVISWTTTPLKLLRHFQTTQEDEKSKMEDDLRKENENGRRPKFLLLEN
jgi:hypothetical protein